MDKKDSKLVCASCGGPVENDYKPGGSRPVYSRDGTLYCSSMCLWRDKYIVARGLAQKRPAKAKG
jgi:hypothetical protein